MQPQRRLVDNRPIGIFDSGIGGLTVVKEIARRLPHESVLYFGDSKRCPYGPRPFLQTRSFVVQIGRWLLKNDVKLLVIACNTATAAGLETAQREFDVPVIGVVEPGARAAIRATRSRRIGVIGTKATIESNIYEEAMHQLDAGVSVYSKATPKFVEMAEEGLQHEMAITGGDMRDFSSSLETDEYHKIAKDYLDPLIAQDIDTLVMGCTHFPLLYSLIAETTGDDIAIISSAKETATEIAETLARRGQKASARHVPQYRFATTSDSASEFSVAGALIFHHPVNDPVHVSIDELEALFKSDGWQKGIADDK